MVRVPQQYANFTYYGRGPIDNYADRKVGQFIEQHKNTVAGGSSTSPNRSAGNHEDVRWCPDQQCRQRCRVYSHRPFVKLALPYSALDLILASHPYQLPKAGDTYLHLDAAVTGLGGNSCGQGGPLEQDRVFASHHNTGFIIRPAGKDDCNNQYSPRRRSAVVHNPQPCRCGICIITEKNAVILYTVDKS